jgi:hypothetical protein
MKPTESWRRSRIVVFICVVLVAGVWALLLIRRGAQPSPRPPERATEKPAIEAWAGFARPSADEVEHYDSLNEITDGAGLVIDGTVEDVDEGRIFGLEDLGGGGAVRYVLLHVRVDDVLAGTGAGEEDILKLELGPVEMEVPVLEAYGDLVGDRAIFFLRLKGEGIPELGIGPDPEERGLGFYRLVSTQGLFLNDQGAVALPMWVDEGFPSEYEGMPFGQALNQVETAGR